MTNYVVQPFYASPIGSPAVSEALEIRKASPTLPDPDELANLEGRAERYEAEPMRAEDHVARLQEICAGYEKTLRLAQDQTEALRVELKFSRSAELEAYRERDIHRAENANLKARLERMGVDLRCALEVM